MSSVNQVTLLGNVGKDPDIRHTQGGDAIANFSIATSEKWRDKSSGEDKEKTEWHRVVVFGKLAEIVERYVKKGSKVYVQGKLQTRKWTDKEDVERQTTEIVLSGFGSQLVLLGEKRGTNGGDRAQQGPIEPKGGKMQDELDDEIPF